MHKLRHFTNWEPFSPVLVITPHISLIYFFVISKSGNLLFLWYPVLVLSQAYFGWSYGFLLFPSFWYTANQPTNKRGCLFNLEAVRGILAPIFIFFVWMTWKIDIAEFPKTIKKSTNSVCTSSFSFLAQVKQTY